MGNVRDENGKTNVVEMPAHEVSQLRLAEILDLEQRFEEVKKELEFRLAELCRDLERGAHIELGPIHAGLEVFKEENGRVGVKLVVR